MINSESKGEGEELHHPPYAVHRSWDRDYKVIDHTDGIYLYDRDGNRFIDGTAGSAVVVNIGHNVQEVNDAMLAQARKFNFYPAHAFTNDQFQALAERLVNMAPAGMKGDSKVWLTDSGTGASEDALRLARQHFVDKGMAGRFLVIGRWQAFHGNSIAVAGVSGLTLRRSVFAPMFIGAPHIPPAFCYRCYFGLDCATCGLRCAQALETEILQNGPENVAAFIAEPVVGAALGGVPAPDGYFQKVREICDGYGVLLIIDEVMTGIGRTGKMWGIEHWEGVTPDILITAKGLTSGYTPLSAVIARNEIWEPLIDSNSPYRAGRTLNANAVSCAGALAVLDYVDKHNLVQHTAEVGEYMLAEMKDKLLKHPFVGDVRGKGLMIGFELVKDKETKEPFDPALHLSKELEDEAYDRGLIIYPLVGTVAGHAGDMVLMSPPLIITKEQVDDLVRILDESVSAVEAKLR
jgi:adenosylmethionine-8-amino-7-oxononanoate aminotransferase